MTQSVGLSSDLRTSINWRTIEPCFLGNEQVSVRVQCFQISSVGDREAIFQIVPHKESSILLAMACIAPLQYSSFALLLLDRLAVQEGYRYLSAQ